MMTVPNRDASPLLVSAWVFMELMPSVLQKCGPEGMKAFIGIAHNREPTQGSLTEASLKRFAKATGGSILDPELLDFLDLRVKTAVGRIRTTSGNGFNLALRALPAPGRAH